MTTLDALDKGRRKEIVKTAEIAFKNGATPSAPDDGTPLAVSTMPRYKTRQLARELGIPGSKSMRKNPGKAQRRLQRRAQEIQRALMGDEALAVAEQRVLHPVRSRVRGIR